MRWIVSGALAACISVAQAQGESVMVKRPAELREMPGDGTRSLAALPAQAPAGTTATSTLGIRGLGAEDLAQAQPNLGAVGQVQAWRLDAEQARQFAASAALASQAVEPLPGPPCRVYSPAARPPIRICSHEFVLFFTRQGRGLAHARAPGLAERCGPGTEPGCGRALNLFQSFLRPAPAAQSAPAARAGLLTQAIGSQLKGHLGAAVSAQLLSLGRDLYSRGLDQGDEFEADRNGVALAARAGFDPYGLVAVLQQLRTATPDNPLFALSLSTHPPAQLRLDQLEQAVGNRLDGLAGQPMVTVAQRLERLTAASRGKAAPGATQTAAPLRSPAKQKN